MREIRFRCFYGGKMYDVEELRDGRVNSIVMDIEGVLRSVSPDSEHVKSIMQFTGLLDKNGVDIYEGDLLITHNTQLAKPENILAVKYSGSSFVIYNPKCCDTCKNGFSYISSLDEWDQYEVAGNIHQNPELLK